MRVKASSAENLPARRPTISTVIGKNLHLDPTSIFYGIPRVYPQVADVSLDMESIRHDALVKAVEDSVSINSNFSLRSYALQYAKYLKRVDDNKAYVANRQQLEQSVDANSSKPQTAPPRRKRKAREPSKLVSTIRDAEHGCDSPSLFVKKWVCDVCKVREFTDFDEACRHEEVCQGSHALAVKVAENRQKRKKK